jgi:threonine dehydrogenase-like Zn-dependent dehydrogenase
MALRFGATAVLDPASTDVVAAIRHMTGGRGVDVAIEALGRQETFDAALRATRVGGTVSSLGVYSGKLAAGVDAIHAGLGDQTIVTTLCPGGKERMRRLIEMVAHERIDFSPLVTHRFALADLPDALKLFAAQRDGVLKVALFPHGVPRRADMRREAVDAVC